MAAAGKILKVAVAGASGETGMSVMNAILAAPHQFQVTVLGRGSSVASKPAYADLARRGALVQAVDFNDVDTLAQHLKGLDVVVSCFAAVFDQESNLIHAASRAGVGRFVPSFWASVAPARGVMWLRESKEDMLDLIKRLYLPYTVIDIGWWLQFSIPLVPSGRLDKAVVQPERAIVGDGNAKTALTDVADIGRFAARVIADPRTLNKMVFCFGDVTTQNHVWAKVEELTGEKVDRKVISREDVEKIITDADEALARNPADKEALVSKSLAQYADSRGIRGDNSPEYAAYLGYLLGSDLYPDFKSKKVDDFIKELVNGTRTAVVYAGRSMDLSTWGE